MIFGGTFGLPYFNFWDEFLSVHVSLYVSRFDRKVNTQHISEITSLGARAKCQHVHMTHLNGRSCSPAQRHKASKILTWAELTPGARFPSVLPLCSAQGLLLPAVHSWKKLPPCLGGEEREKWSSHPSAERRLWAPHGEAAARRVSRRSSNQCGVRGREGAVTTEQLYPGS